MKIVCCADVHVGVRTYGKIDPVSGLNTREIKTLEILEELVNYTIDNQIEVLIIAGDMYKNNLPTPTLQDEVDKRLKKASDAGVKLLILDGNHDVSKMENTTSALKKFDTFGVPEVVHTRFHKEYVYQGIKFVFLPTYHTKEDIEKIVDNTIYDMPTIFIGHMTIQNALMNDWLIAEQEVFIDAELFDKPNVTAVVLGHLHKYQVLLEKPLVFYTGSTQRIDFNEERQPKGFVVLDVNGTSVSHEFVEVQAQKFTTIKMNVIKSQNPMEDIIKEIDSKSRKIKDSIVRIKLELNEETKLDEKIIYEHLYKLGADTILDIIKEFEQQKIVKNAELNEHVSIEKGLELYYKDKPRSKERIQLGKEIIKKVDSND